MQVIKSDSTRVFVVANDNGKELAKIYINQNGPYDIAYTPKDDNWLAHGDDTSYWQVDPELKAFCEAQAQELSKRDFGDQNELEKQLCKSEPAVFSFCELGFTLNFKNGSTIEYKIGQKAPAEIYSLLPNTDKKEVNKLFKDMIKNLMVFHNDEISEFFSDGILVQSGTNRKLFEAALLKANISKEELAKKLNTSTPNLYSKLRGVVPFTQKELAAIKLWLRLNNQDFCTIFFS